MGIALDTTVLREYTRLSFERPGAFPEVVRRLSAAGVERYHVDLTRLEKTYYAGDSAGGSARESLPLPEAPPVAGRFSALAFEAALRDAQAARIGYADFLRRIMAAGVSDYFVCIGGRRAVYLGRQGESHVERFPPAPGQ